MQPSPDLKSLFSAPGSKILVVPSAQAGRKLLTAWARDGVPTLGVRTCTALGLAEAVLEDAAPDKALTRLPELSQILALDAVLAEFDFRRLEALGWSGERMSTSIRQMRVAGISPDEYRKRIPRKLAREVSRVVEAYEKWLYKSGFADEAERFVRAEMAARRAEAPALLAVLAETSVSHAAADFLGAMRTAAARSVVVDTVAPGSGTPPPGSALAALPDWEVIRRAPDTSPEIDLVRVPAVEDEARFVLDEIERLETPLDRVEVAYPRHTPYLPLLLGEAARRGVEVTSAAGTPLSDLPAGQAVRLFLAWLDGGQDSTDLVRLLRSGFVKLTDSASALSVVSYLIQFHARGDRKAYRRAFLGLRKPLQEDMEREVPGAKPRLKRLKEAERAVDRLMGAVPGPTDTARGFAARLRGFVETFVPEPPERDSTAAKGRAELLARLREIEEGPDSPHTSGHLVGRFKRWLDTIIVHARLDKPGALHITPLDSAGLAGRSCLFILGLDSENFLPSSVEDVFLPDDFCSALEQAAGPLSSRERLEARRTALHRAMGRARDSVCMVVGEGRLAADSDVGPATAFIELEARHGSRTVRVPQGSGATRAVLRHRSSGVAEELIKRHFPAVARGREAARRRAEPEFNEFDGFVGARTSVAEVLAGPLSPSRLQELATCPFQYFQGRVLGVREQEERRQGEWMTPLENGSLVHEALNRFNHRIMAGEVDARDTAALLDILRDEFRSFRKGNEPPSEFAWRGKMRELDRIAKVVTAEDREVVAAELGFGQQAHRVQEEYDHVGELPLDLGGTRIALRGRIDVVERTGRGLVITDYKTGRSDDYRETDLLDGGKRLQWVLYAYAYEDLKGETVDESGYLFVSGDAAGQTAYGQPLHRDDVGELLGGLLGLAQRGEFAASADPNRGTPCVWCDYRRVCGDVTGRRDEIRSKLDALVDQGNELLDTWPYARKYLKR